MKESKLLISLDCLLDTVLGTVFKMDKRLVYPLLTKGYLRRNHNCVFLLHDGIDRNTFLEAYENRDTETLKLSRKTNTLVQLGEILKSTSAREPDHPISEVYTVDINIYPYKLNNVEVTVLKEVLSEALFVDDVNIVSYSVTDLTVSLVKEKYTRIILYDVGEWLTQVKHYTDQLVKTPIPSITCEGAFIVREEKVGKRVYLTAKHSMPFDVEAAAFHTCKFFTPFIDLAFTQLPSMSIYMPPMKKPSDNNGEPTGDASEINNIDQLL
jgi:hypothetical protein